MHPDGTTSTVIIVAAVLLFFLVGVAMIVIMDHKARLPGGFTRDPFTIRGMRRDHPVIAFLTAAILLSIILVLVAELALTAATHLGLLKGAQAPRPAPVAAAEAARRFHRDPGPDLAARPRRSVCFPCHDDAAHSKERMVSTLLNMHSQFAGCMTCHLDPKQVPDAAVALRWRNDSGIEVKGRPFGTATDPATGLLAQTDDYYSRIVAYRKDAAGEELLERRSPKRDRHKLVSAKGLACERCHTDAEKSFIPFQALGFSEQRTRELAALNLVGLVDKYKKFHFPAMRGEPPPAPRSAEAGKEESPAAMSRDPQKWWEQKYGRDKKAN